MVAEGHHTSETDPNKDKQLERLVGLVKLVPVPLTMGLEEEEHTLGLELLAVQ
jgi:hypothetical protein